MRGFTLIEALISVAAIALIAGIGIPVYLSFSTRNDLSLTATTLVQNYRRAQVLSEASDGDSSWGVRVASNTITLFKGASFATRDVIYDEENAFPVSITSSGLTEVVFAKFTGLPLSIGTTTLTLVATGDTRTVALNTYGTISD